MSERRLKPGWRWVKLGDVVERHVEHVQDLAPYEHFVGVDDLDSEDLRLRRHGVIGHDPVPPTFRYVFRQGMVLVPTRRPRLRKCAIAPFDGITGEKVLVLKSRDASGLAPELLPFLLSATAVQDWNIGRAIGSVTPHFRWADMADCRFALPPFAEQRRLSTLLRAFAHLIDEYRSIMLNANRLRTALVDHLCESTTSDTVAARLGELLTQPPSSGHSPHETDDDTGCYVLSLSALGAQGYVFNQLKPVLPSPEVVKTRLRKGDLLISRSNTRERVGYVGTFDEDRQDVSFPDTMMRLSPQGERIRGAFLEMLLQSSAMRRQLESIAAGTSGSMKKINKHNLANLRLKVSPLNAQDEAIRCVREVRDGLRFAQERLAVTLGVYATIRDTMLR